MKRTIGLTGSIATGKSTVSQWLKEAGFAVVDADIAARKVVEKGTAGLEEIRQHFGETVLTKEGELNRGKLGKIIFEDAEKRTLLNQIVHPKVKAYMLKEREALFEAGETIVIFDIPLLYESHLEALVDQIVVVRTSRETEIKRLMARDGIQAEAAIQKIDTQMPIEEKEQRADFVIDNDGSLEKTKKQVDHLIQQFKNFQ
ncbi:dephospho-CoA kinase [Listeria costaricensis]|uniref:dephospho-CoA kinase n=1 Tax=Listeria costaricensis TaxID=2026604 RepID=UPI000C074617|nr:dephospho-CoA kinase [Listeria costaricensis]